MYSYLCIEYANPSNHQDSITINFKLRNSSIVPPWIDQVLKAQQKYSIDDPSRFYGFGSFDEQEKTALLKINNCIDIINSHEKIITRKLTSVADQDTLNYLHNIFEIYHGLLNQQTHPFFVSANKQVQNALADLNICVHSCESISRGNKPRHVVTYFGLPKTKTLSNEHYDLFTDIFEFGTVYLNYVEIGKTIEDLAIDNDRYISDEAFKPFNFFSADFAVNFSKPDLSQVFNKRDLVREYYLTHSKFFLDRGYYAGHPHLNLGKIPLADIDYSHRDVLQSVQTRQYVKSVNFI
jgi:hypothetical protein